MPLDLASFKPNTADELLKGIVDHVSEILADQWKKVRSDMTTHFSAISQASFQTIRLLKTKKISKQEADFAFHLQEVALNQAITYSKLLTYVTAQKVLNGVFEVIMSAVRNITGVKLAWLFEI